MAEHGGRTAQTVSVALAFWGKVLPARQCELVSKYLSALEPEMLGYLSPCEQLAEPARHLILAGGRRIRPVVLLSACDCLHGDWTRAVRQAAAVEFIHTASLIHDDIIDRSPTRRGVPTVHETNGMQAALLTGDALCFVALGLSAAVPGVTTLLAEACREMCIGEALGAGLEAAEKKTASLFRAAAEIGALTAQARPAEAAALRQYGLMLGMAYQLRDDQLDAEGTADPLPYAETARASIHDLPAGTPKDLLRDLSEFAALRPQ